MTTGFNVASNFVNSGQTEVLIDLEHHRHLGVI